MVAWVLPGVLPGVTRQRGCDHVAVSVARCIVGYISLLKHSEERRAVTDPMPHELTVICVLLPPNPCPTFSMGGSDRGCSGMTSIIVVVLK